MFQAIETRYAGCRFRSRLEARWAVFFDHMKIKWEYEPQGFHTDAGPYLPDFRLPDLKLIVEIKGRRPNDREFAVGAEVAKRCQKHGGAFVIFAGDIPYGQEAAKEKTAWLYSPRGEWWTQSVALTWWRFTGYPDAQWSIELSDALNAARSARFEHGRAIVEADLEEYSETDTDGYEIEDEWEEIDQP